MKTNEELKALKAEIETLNRKLRELTDEEQSDLIKPQKIILNKRHANDYYDRREIEKQLPYFQVPIMDGWKKILYQFDNSCVLTGKHIKVNQNTKGMEHFIPLAIGHGGTNEQNVYPMDRFLNYSNNH